MTFDICPPISNGHVIVVCCILYARLRVLLSGLEWSRSFCKMTREISSLITEVESVELFPNGFNLFFEIMDIDQFQFEKDGVTCSSFLKNSCEFECPLVTDISRHGDVIWPIRLILLGCLLNQSILEQSPNESWAARSRFKQWSLLLSLGM